MKHTRIWAFALIAALLLACCGCHGLKQQNTFTVPETFDTSRQYEVVFWAKNDTNQVQVQAYKDAIAAFEALYPNITVKLKHYTDYGRIYNDVITNISTGTTPDVCITYPDHVATYMAGGNTVVPLDALMADEKYGLGGSELRFDGPTAEEIIPKFLEECRIGDAYYALPFIRSTEACYINKTYVEKLGYTLPEKLTWDFVWEVSEAAMEKDADGNYKVNGQKVMIPFIYKSTDNMMIQMLKQKGAGYSTEAGSVEIFNDTTEALLYDLAAHCETGAFSTFKISSYPGNFLNAGQCLFAIDSTAGATWMGSTAPNIDIPADQLVHFEMAVMEIPQFDTENPQMISQGPSLCVFNKEDPQQVLASWLFAQYLLTNEVQIGYATTEGYAPVTSKAQQSQAYQDYLEDPKEYSVKIAATKLLMDNVDNTFVTPVFNGSASLRNAAGQMIENVTKAVRRNQTVDGAFMEKLYGDMKAQYHLDQIQAAPGGDLGPLPDTAWLLLGGLTACWAGIAGFTLGKKWKNRIQKQENRG